MYNSTEATRTRRIPTEEDFMNHSIDDLVYGYLQYMSTYNTEMKMLYVTNAKVKSAKKDIAGLIGKDSRTVTRKIDALKTAGYLAIVKDNEDREVYTFPYDKNDRDYQIVTQEMLFYVISTRNAFAVKIYIWLLDKYLWKKRLHEDGYSFTKKEIALALGYSESVASQGGTMVSKAIDNNLESFLREGIIKFECFYQKNAEGKPVPRMRLQFVATSKYELRELDATKETKDYFSLENNEFIKPIKIGKVDDERLEEIGRSLEGWELL